MKKILSTLYFLFLLSYCCISQIGIGTTTPNAKAALDIKATDKGVLFPNLTTVQRNAITNPPNGLHVFNSEERCLNYYDSVNAIWNCYCSHCQAVVVSISSNVCELDFYNTYAKFSPATKYIVRVEAGVTVSGCSPGDTALSFSNMSPNVSVIVINHGTIAGAGGTGGSGAIESGCITSFAFATPGQAGGYAISTKAGVPVTVNNYGIIAGGGGGGGGSTKNPSGQGGGGGGGAGIVGGVGGTAGGVYQFSGGPISVCVPAITAQPGTPGQPTLAGTGGAGNAGGGTGGNGGLRGQTGQNGTGTFAATGGAGGKAIGGGSGNILNNISGGQSFGAVD
jgi:hypothetical protein